MSNLNLGKISSTCLLPTAMPFLRRTWLTLGSFADVIRKVKKATRAKEKNVALQLGPCYTRDPLVDASSCYSSPKSKIILVASWPCGWNKAGKPFKDTCFGAVSSRGVCKLIGLNDFYITDA